MSIVEVGAALTEAPLSRHQTQRPSRAIPPGSPPDPDRASVPISSVGRAPDMARPEVRGSTPLSSDFDPSSGYPPRPMTELAHPDRLAQGRRHARGRGIDPYPARAAWPGHAHLRGGRRAAAPRRSPARWWARRMTIAGRLMLPARLRQAHLRSGPGPHRPAAGRALQKKALAEWWPRRKDLDGGDLVGVTGELGHTQKGELTDLGQTRYGCFAKSLAPPPEKWHGLVDVEARYRRRYVDLWASEGVARGVRQARPQVLSGMRALPRRPGATWRSRPPRCTRSSAAPPRRPFVTHYNALERGLLPAHRAGALPQAPDRRRPRAASTRSPATSATRACRPRHNPEFSMLELYEAQADYRRMMEITEGMLETLALDLNGTRPRSTFRGRTYDLKAPFERRRLHGPASSELTRAASSTTRRRSGPAPPSSASRSPRATGGS